MEFNFNGKRALVTGAGKGMGRSLVEALHTGGASVCAISRTQSDLDSLKEECPGIVTVCFDLTDWERTQSELKLLGDFDLLINNAGIMSPSFVLDVTQETFDSNFDTNVKAVVNVTQMVARGMVDKKKGGAIVNISSILSQTHVPGSYAYSASKAALDQLTRCMAVELGPHQIRVNGVLPTLVPETPSSKISLKRAPGILDPMLARTPLGHWAAIADVINVTLYLLSEKADMINGALVPVDGGYKCT